MFLFRFFSALMFFVLFSGVSYADFLRIEGGIGVFAADPGGSIEGTNGGDVSLDDLGIDKESDLYAWVFLKHPIPIIPNARIEYLSMKHSPDNGDNYTVNELDGILYYNLFDNLLWVTADLGIDFKYISTAEESMDDETTLALLYARVRLEPIRWLGVEALLKATNYQDNSGYDARLKIDYTMTFIPVIQPGLELGYRIHKIQYKIGDVINKSEYTGVYGGLMLRF